MVGKNGAKSIYQSRLTGVVQTGESMLEALEARLASPPPAWPAAARASPPPPPPPAAATAPSHCCRCCLLVLPPDPGRRWLPLTPWMRRAAGARCRCYHGRRRRCPLPMGGGAGGWAACATQRGAPLAGAQTQRLLPSTPTGRRSWAGREGEEGGKRFEGAAVLPHAGMQPQAPRLARHAISHARSARRSELRCRHQPPRQRSAPQQALTRRT